MTLNIKLGKTTVRLCQVRIVHNLEAEFACSFNGSRVQDMFADLSFDTDSKARASRTPQNAQKMSSLSTFSDPLKTPPQKWYRMQFGDFGASSSRRSKAVKVPTPKPTSMTSCTICLEKLALKTAELPNCGHTYCFKCLKQWMKVSNTCPVCKAEFINYEVRHDGQLLRRGKAEPRKQVYEEIVTSEDRIISNADDVCYACQDGSEVNYLLICDGCLTKCCHTFCLKPPLKFVPQDEWFCDYCVRDTSFHSKYPTAKLFKKTNRRRSKGRSQLPCKGGSKRGHSRKSVN